MICTELKKKADLSKEEAFLLRVAMATWQDLTYSAREEARELGGANLAQRAEITDEEIMVYWEKTFGFTRDQVDNDFVQGLIEDYREDDANKEASRRACYLAAKARGERPLPLAPPTEGDYDQAISWVENEQTIQSMKWNIQPSLSIQRERQPALPLALTCLAVGGMWLTRYYPIPNIGTLR